MCRILRRDGHRSVEAGNGVEGMAALIHTDFDLVICDMLMPVQDGINTIRRIRNVDESIPIIVVTGAFGAKSLSPHDLAIAMGADAALHKPFTKEQLLAAVNGLLDSDQVLSRQT